MAGIDARTGKPLSGWLHVVQSARKIFSTGYGERWGRRWFGSMVPALLGQLAVESSVLRHFTAIYVALELWEPRLKFESVALASTAEQVRAGLGVFDLEVTYLPRGHLGDTTPAGRRTIALEADAAGAVGVA